MVMNTQDYGPGLLSNTGENVHDATDLGWRVPIIDGEGCQKGVDDDEPKRDLEAFLHLGRDVDCGGDELFHLVVIQQSRWMGYDANWQSVRLPAAVLEPPMLIEKRSEGTKTSRFQSPGYRACGFGRNIQCPALSGLFGEEGAPTSKRPGEVNGRE